MDGQGDLVGEVLDTLQVDIVSSNPGSEIGEIIVHSPSLYTGYFGHPPRDKNAGLSLET